MFVVEAELKENILPLRESNRSGNGYQCSYYSCSSTFYSNGRRTSFHFFKMPLKSPQKTLWCNRMGKREGVDGFSVTNNTKVCHLHFRPEDIMKVFSQFQNLHHCHLYLVNIIVVII